MIFCLLSSYHPKKSVCKTGCHIYHGFHWEFEENNSPTSKMNQGASAIFHHNIQSWKYKICLLLQCKCLQNFCNLTAILSLQLLFQEVRPQNGGTQQLLWRVKRGNPRGSVKESLRITLLFKNLLRIFLEWRISHTCFVWLKGKNQT